MRSAILLHPSTARGPHAAAIALLVALAALVAAPAVHAQDPTPPTPVLPDLAPREVEIRGELEIAFPSLQRQPLVGFNPPPRVIEIDPNRRPYVAAYKQEKADLPPSPLVQPEPPEVSPLAGQEPIDGEFSAGLGSYFSRFAQARGGLALGGPARPGLYGRLEYDGTDGHLPVDSLVGRRSSYDLLEGVGGLTFANAASRGGAELDGFYQDYVLFGRRIEDPFPFGPEARLDSLPERRGRGLGLAAWFETGGPTTASFEGRVRFGGARYETDVFAETGSDEADPEFVSDAAADALARAEQTERRIDADLLAELPIAAGTLLLDGAAGSAGHDLRGDVDGSAAYLDLGGALRFLYVGRFTVTAGARVLLFDAAGAPQDDERWGFLSPLVRIETYPTPRLRLYAENRPRVEPNSLSDLYRRNPYLADEPQLQPTLRTVDAEAGASFFTGPVQLVGRVGYRRAPNHLFFEELPDASLATSGGAVAGVFAARYGEAEILHAGGDLSVVLPAGFHATVGASVRQGRLTELDMELPYFAPVVGQAMLSYSFAGSRGLAQLVGHFESARPRTAVASLDDLPFELGDAGAFLDLDVRASYNVSESIGVLARIENVGGAERWEGYPAPPAVLVAGLRIRW